MDTIWSHAAVVPAREAGRVYRRPLDIPIGNTILGILRDLAGRGQRALIVGGAVRDALQGARAKDIDIEVYGTSYEDLACALAAYGRTDLVGRSFGVVKLLLRDGSDYDFSIPRRENKTGIHHRDFSVSFDASITPAEASARRDFTINAMSYDPLAEEIHDYYGGAADLEHRLLRHTGPAFAEDPLRVLRGMQLAGRLAMTLAPATARMIREELSNEEHYHSLATERVAEEWMKWATRSQKPGLGLQFLKESGWLKFYPSLAAMDGLPQDPEWHPEGDVLAHTIHVVDSAAEIADREKLTGDERAVLLIAALAHDFGKATTTELREKGGRLRWTAHGHEEASGPLADQFLRSTGIKGDVIRRVLPMIENHLAHIRFQSALTGAGQIRQLADRLYPATIEDLARLLEADASGRPPLPSGMPPSARLLLDLAREDGCSQGRPRPLIQGRDVMPYYGGVGGPHIGEAAAAAYQAQLKGQINNPQEAAAWLKNYLKRKAAWIKGQDVLPYFQGEAGPHVGEVLRAAWEAQLNEEFNSRDSALAWLENYMAVRSTRIPEVML